MATIKTISGDTWDILSKRHYGDEMFMDVLIKANIDHRKTVIFPAGVTLNAPELDTAAIEESKLPPWKRTGGA